MFIARSYRRFFAYLLDQFFVGLLFLPIWIQAGASWVRYQNFQIEISLLVFCYLSRFFYEWIFLRLLGGTLGKLMWGLRVVNKVDGGELSWMQSLLRVLTNQLSLFFGPAHRILAFARFDRTHLADWVAETQVRQFRAREGYPKRNIPLTLVIVLYLATSSFIQAYRVIQRVEIEQGQVILHPTPPNDNLSSSGL